MYTIQRRVHNIGILKYFSTILFGKNRTAKRMSARMKAESGLYEEVLNKEVDYVVTIGKNAIILTSLLGAESQTARRPLLTVPWKEIERTKDRISGDMITYMDIDGFEYTHIIGEYGEELELEGNIDGEEIFYTIEFETAQDHR